MEFPQGYIKMCEKAIKIQEAWQPDATSFIVSHPEMPELINGESPKAVNPILYE